MTYTVAVRTLCEFTAKTGDLDLRFTPSPTAREGIAGHTLVTSRRADDYEREVSLSGTYKGLSVKGRADGYDPRRNRLEEIKTFRGEVDSIPPNHRALHWAQAKIYGLLLCRARELDDVNLALVYFDIVKQREHLVVQSYTLAELEDFFSAECEKFLQWAEQEAVHRQERDRALEKMAFPHGEFRKGQRPLAEAVYHAAITGYCLLAEAPTGIGKTVGTLFPLLKAMPRASLDKIFFLCAKTPGRRLALDAVVTLDSKPLRTLELIAREKSCEHPDKACHGESCPLAQGFYDRLPAARREAAAEQLLDQARLRDIALAHSVCPYYLSQEMARWSDVIVGDYNYYFDTSAMLYGLTVNNQWQTALLVDEAHNLVERARGMYSAELDQQKFRTVKQTAPAALKRSLNKLGREWNAVNREMPEAMDYQPRSQLASPFLTALQLTAAAITEWMTEQPVPLDSALTQFYFDALHFLRIADLYNDQNYIFDVTRSRVGRGRVSTTLSLRNVIPAPELKLRFATAQSATLFSATLKPAAYYNSLLGLPDNARYLEVPSPFSPEQLRVRIEHTISTRYQHRDASREPIARLIQMQYSRQPGNYLAFFSSYDYLQQVLASVQAFYPQLPVWSQEKRMDENAREAFLARFQEKGQGVGFAVLGGAFAEGIDLPGARLIGAFVATLGLPQINPVNEQIKARMGQCFNDGYSYTYLYPGICKVVQAAGRVIRTERDRGVVYLIDDRFKQKSVQSLLPSWWALE